MHEKGRLQETIPKDNQEWFWNYVRREVCLMQQVHLIQSQEFGVQICACMQILAHVFLSFCLLG